MRPKPIAALDRLEHGSRPAGRPGQSWAAPGSEVGMDAVELANAAQVFRAQRGRAPNAAEILALLRRLGWRRVSRRL